MTNTLDYNALVNEITRLLESTQTITLATSLEDKVTARTMSIVNDGLTIMFQTGDNSEKSQQMRQNPHVAFAFGNVQVEAMVSFCGHPSGNPVFLDKYKTKYPQYHAMYTDMPDEVLVTATPVKFSLYKYIDGKPCVDVLDIIKSTAVREVLM